MSSEIDVSALYREHVVSAAAAGKAPMNFRAFKAAVLGNDTPVVVPQNADALREKAAEYIEQKAKTTGQGEAVVTGRFMEDVDKAAGVDLSWAQIEEYKKNKVRLAGPDKHKDRDFPSYAQAHRITRIIGGVSTLCPPLMGLIIASGTAAWYYGVCGLTRDKATRVLDRIISDEKKGLVTPRGELIKLLSDLGVTLDCNEQRLSAAAKKLVPVAE